MSEYETLVGSDYGTGSETVRTPETSAETDDDLNTAEPLPKISQREFAQMNLSLDLVDSLEGINAVEDPDEKQALLDNVCHRLIEDNALAGDDNAEAELSVEQFQTLKERVGVMASATIEARRLLGKAPEDELSALERKIVTAMAVVLMNPRNPSGPGKAPADAGKCILIDTETMPKGDNPALVKINEHGQLVISTQVLETRRDLATVVHDLEETLGLNARRAETPTEEGNGLGLEDQPAFPDGDPRAKILEYIESVGGTLEDLNLIAQFQNNTRNFSLSKFTLEMQRVKSRDGKFQRFEMYGHPDLERGSTILAYRKAQKAIEQVKEQPGTAVEIPSEITGVETFRQMLDQYAGLHRNIINKLTEEGVQLSDLESMGFGENILNEMGDSGSDESESSGEEQGGKGDIAQDEGGGKGVARDDKTKLTLFQYIAGLYPAEVIEGANQDFENLNPFKTILGL